MGLAVDLPGNNQSWGLSVRHQWRSVSSSRSESITYRSYVPEKVMCRKSPCLPGDANCCGMPAVSRVYGTAHNYEGPSGVKMLSIFHPRRTQCWKVISNSTTPCNDSVPNQRAATWTILPRCFIQKGTAYGLGRHTCVRLRIWGYG